MFNLIQIRLKYHPHARWLSSCAVLTQILTAFIIFFPNVLVGQKVESGRESPLTSAGFQELFSDNNPFVQAEIPRIEPLIYEAQPRFHFSDHVSLRGDSSEPTNKKLPFLAGYDDGFFIAEGVADNNRLEEAPYLLKLNGWGQLRMSNYISANEIGDFNQIQLKRARMIFSGNAFSPNFTWLIALDGRSQADGAIRLLDYYMDYDLGKHFWGLERRAFTIKLGQYKIPFSLARSISAQELQFSDRSVASMFFDANRSLAYGIAGQRQLPRSLQKWEVAIFNGLVTGGAETGGSGNLDNNFAFSGRLSSYFGSDWGGDDICDYDWHETPAFRVGSGFAVSQIDRLGINEFDAMRVVDSGNRLSGLLPAEVSEFKVAMYAVDASWKYRGFSFTSEYYFRNISGFQGIVQSDLFDHGFSLETGYFVLPKKMELLARWSRVVGESGTLGVANQSSDERAIGSVWYFRRHSAKLTVDLTYLDGAPVDSFSLDIEPGAKGWLARTQMQFSF